MTPEVSKSMCKRCGSRYGLHFGDTCPDAHGKPSKTGRKFLAFGVAAPTLSSPCPTCGQKVPRVIKIGDVVAMRVGIRAGKVGLVVKLSKLYPERQCWVLLQGDVQPRSRQNSDLDLLHGYFHITERVGP